MRERLIGVAGPLSGPRSVYGQMLVREVQQVQLPANVSIVFRDDAADVAKAAEVAREFVALGVHGVVGHFNSECARVAGNLYHHAQIPLILPAATRQDLTDNPSIFRLCANDKKQIDAILHGIASRPHGRISIWSDGSFYANDLKALLLGSSKRENITKWIDLESLRGGDTLVCLGAHYLVAQFIVIHRSLLKDVQIICCDDCSTKEFVDLICKSNSDVWLVVPRPSFAECVRGAMKIVANYFLEADEERMLSWLFRRSYFQNHDNPQASFSLIPIF